ncbi:phage tail protein [Pantoea wallisii]|uniref:Phage tail protein n=1 Tax=Pantoea wallisii TaxID=1076551 RepID=A0A1X1DCJ8_9GAMM|nr:GpE family phage tail protein [Pantoea wallisii]ORM74412.1 phage tail protein [Pantoea wallisii]
MADIATLFHWPPSVMYEMPLAELLDWRHKAFIRSGATPDEQ